MIIVLILRRNKPTKDCVLDGSITTTTLTPATTITTTTVPFITPTSFSVHLGTVLGTICSISESTVYITGTTFESGVILYVNPTFNTKVIGYDYVSPVYSAEGGSGVTGWIFNLNSTTGVVGTNTGETACSIA